MEQQWLMIRDTRNVHGRSVTNQCEVEQNKIDR